MRRFTKHITGLALAAGVFGSGAAMAMDDNYDSSTTYYYESAPSTTYQEPSTTYLQEPRTMYYDESPTYAPRGVYGYYDNPYNPYWSYQGPLGQGSGHDMRFGR